MKILVYKRTHTGDPDESREFGIEGCMGRVRGFNFDAVIGIGGISTQPRQQGIAEKINWVGINPTKRRCKIDARGPSAFFEAKHFRLYEENGPYLAALAPMLAKRLYNSRARYIFSTISPAEKLEAISIIDRMIKAKEFDHLVLGKTKSNRAAKLCGRKRICIRKRKKACC